MVDPTILTKQLEIIIIQLTIIANMLSIVAWLTVCGILINVLVHR